MGLEAVVNEIRAKGDREVARIKSEAEVEAKVIVDDAIKRSEEIRVAAEADSALQADRILIREVAAANLVVKRDQLNTQKELLDEVYAKAVKEIANFPVDVHARAVRSLLKDASKQIKQGIVYVNLRDEEAAKAALMELKTLSGFTFGGIVDIDGGVIVRSTDCQITLDLSYQTFMDDVWESSLKDASEILFGSNP